jgi:phosphate/sulfate permease
MESCMRDRIIRYFPLAERACFPQVGNSIGPLMGALQGSAQTAFVARMQSPTLLSVCGGVLFVLGIVTVGSRTIATVFIRGRAVIRQ